MAVQEFYDDLTPMYHLIYQDWDASMRRHGSQLAVIINAFWPSTNTVLDVACGIGTQALALASAGFTVTGADVSSRSVERARDEAASRDLAIDFSVCDMREASVCYNSGHDLVIAADNAVPHLLTDEDILKAFEQMLLCLRPGGGCLITVRDYEKEERGTNIVRPYGARIENGKRYLIFQVWDFDGDYYDLTFFFIEEDLSTQKVIPHTMRTRYYAISTQQLCELMEKAGFQNVKRLDGVFYQPVLVGTKP